LLRACRRCRCQAEDDKSYSHDPTQCHV
jgi:hypothetical protein